MRGDAKAWKRHPDAAQRALQTNDYANRQAGFPAALEAAEGFSQRDACLAQSAFEPGGLYREMRGQAPFGNDHQRVSQPRAGTFSA
jgi:hypothetical protein